MDEVNYSTLTYVFSTTTAFLAASAMIASVIKAVRTRQFYGRYFLMFVTGAFAFVRAMLDIAYLVQASAAFDDALDRNMMARLFLTNMFVPLLYCVFIEVCRSIILANDEAPSQTRSVYKVYPAYSAYMWTAVLGVTNIARSALGMNSLRSRTYVFSSAMHSLTSLNHYGIWVLFVLSITQILAGHKELRDCTVSLYTFLVTVVVANIADTVGTTISSPYTYFMTMFIMMDLVGLLGLWFALWASARYWPRKSKLVITNRPHYGYYMPSPESGASFVSQSQQTLTTGKGSLKDQAQLR